MKTEITSFTLISMLAHTHLNSISLSFSLSSLGISLIEQNALWVIKSGCVEFSTTAVVGLTQPYGTGAAPRSWGEKTRGAFPPTKPLPRPPLRLIPAFKLKSILLPVTLHPSSSPLFSLTHLSHLLLSSILLPKPILPGIQLHHIRVNPV